MNVHRRTMDYTLQYFNEQIDENNMHAHNKDLN